MTCLTLWLKEFLPKHERLKRDKIDQFKRREMRWRSWVLFSSLCVLLTLDVPLEFVFKCILKMTPSHCEIFLMSCVFCFRLHSWDLRSGLWKWFLYMSTRCFCFAGLLYLEQPRSCERPRTTKAEVVAKLLVQASRRSWISHSRFPRGLTQEFA